MGVHGFIGTFGQIPSFIIAALVSLYLNWHLVFLLWGCLVTVMLFLSLKLRGYADELEKRKHIVMDYKSALKTMLSMAIIMVLLLTIFRGLYYRGTITILPFYARDVGGYSKLVASILATIVLIAAAPGHLFGGWFTDKTDAKKPLVIFTVLCLVSIPLLMSTSFVVLIAGICLFGFSFFSAQSSLNTLIANITTERIRGVFYGITFATRFGLSYIAPLTLGIVADIYSLDYAFYIIFVFTIAALITAICVWLFLKDEQIDSGA
jgi:MFS family permease